MKDKILYLILGILIGAVITAGCFLVFSKNSESQMNGEMPDMSERGDMQMPEDGDFEKPDKSMDDSDNSDNSSDTVSDDTSSDV